MRATLFRESPTPPPVCEIQLALSVQEFKDLQALASCSINAIAEAMRTSTAPERKRYYSCKTVNLFSLLKAIKDITL